MHSTSVSIAVINHNYGRFIRAAIDSALNQTFANVEVIVVDDGSTDGSREVVATYGDRVSLVLQPCLGHVAAANAAFAAAKGDLVIFLDADDALHERVAASVAEIWKPDASKVQYRLATIDADGLDQDMDFPHFPEGTTPASVLADSLASGSYIWPVSTGNAFSRGFLKHVMPIDPVRIFKSPDGFLNKLAPLYGPVLTLPVVLGSYRVHGKNGWAQDAHSVNVTNMERTVRLDQELDLIFQQEAEKQGHRLGSPLVPRPNAVEIRFLAYRFRRADTIVAGDTRIGLLRLGLTSAIRQRGAGFTMRLGWAIWFLMIALMPLALLAPIVRHGRGQTGRSAIAKHFLRLGRWA